MLVESVEALVWFIRLVLLGGLAWGAWLCIGQSLLPARPQKTLGVLLQAG